MRLVGASAPTEFRLAPLGATNGTWRGVREPQLPRVRGQGRLASMGRPAATPTYSSDIRPVFHTLAKPRIRSLH
jgi:hypothetical protein